MKYSHPICHQEVQPSLFCALQDKVSEGCYVFWPGDVPIPIYSFLTCEPQRSGFTELSLTWDRTDFCPPPKLDVHTIIWLEQLTRGCIEILQFEITGSLQCHPKALGMPPPLPQYVFGKASRPCADVTKVQKLALTVLCKRFLYNERGLLHHLFKQACMCWANKTSVHHCNFDQLTPCESFGLVNMLSKQWSMLLIFIAALNTETMQYNMMLSLKGWFILGCKNTVCLVPVEITLYILEWLGTADNSVVTRCYYSGVATISYNIIYRCKIHRSSLRWQL